MKTEFFDLDKRKVIKTVEEIVPLVDKSFVTIEGKTYDSYTPIFNCDTMTIRIAIWLNPEHQNL